MPDDFPADFEPSIDSPDALRVLDLGVLAYRPAYERQGAVHERVVDGRWSPTLLLVEHEPVITVSRRQSSQANLLADAARLAMLGIDVQPTDRGGDITYHGPGQLVAYPILPLKPLGFNVGHYMRFLETVVIDTLATFGIAGTRDVGATGVWVDTPAGKAKVCAMGIRVKRNVTLHGLALNVAPNMQHFSTIVPCGLAGRPVTSMRQLMGDVTPSMDAVKQTLTRTFTQHYNNARGVSVCDG
jgi:lipoyl(octanoyl) transferase